MALETKFQKIKRPFPFHLIVISLVSFSDHIESIYYFDILKTLKFQWNLDILNVEFLIFSSSLAIFLGSYFSYNMLSWRTHKFLIFSSIFQFLFCFLGSFSRNTYEICSIKFLYGIFYGASSKLIILLLYLNFKHRIKISNFSLMFLQTSQSFTKVWVFLMMLMYEASDPNWGALWMGNSFSALIFFFIATFGVNEDAKNSLDHDFTEIHHECFFKSSLDNETFLAHKTFIKIFGFLLFFEILNKSILITLPFLNEQNGFGVISMIILISGELWGLFIAVAIVVYNFQESQPQKMLHFYVFLVILLMVGIFLKWKTIIWIFLIRIVFATLKNLIYQNCIDKFHKTKQLLNLLIIGDFVLVVIPFLIFPALNFESITFTILLVLAGIMGFIALKLNFSGKGSDFVPELEMNLLKIN